MFGFRNKKTAVSFDRTGKAPVIRSSICTGEQVAGFKDLTTGRFQEVMLLRNDRDLEEFLRLYGVKESELQREW